MSASLTDHMGRPVVVVTGIGIVTTLGEGKEDNWRNLTAGVSGIRKISRFSTENLRTQIAGNVKWEGEGPYCAPAHSIALAKNLPARPSHSHPSAQKGHFPDRCSWPIHLRKPTGISGWLSMMM